MDRIYGMRRGEVCGIKRRLVAGCICLELLGIAWNCLKTGEEIPSGYKCAGARCFNSPFLISWHRLAQVGAGWRGLDSVGDRSSINRMGRILDSPGSIREAPTDRSDLTDRAM